MKDQYVDISPELLGKADPDQQWIEAQLDRIDPWRHEQGADVATDRALRKLVLELRSQLQATQPPRFPTMLRKMWSGTEVQDWINANWNGGAV